MKKIIVSTDNQGKLSEIREILGDSDYRVLSKSEAGYSDLHVDENGHTLKENAKKKVEKYRVSDSYIIGDDTGLFVNALSGRPGIYSARFAGEKANDADNRKKLLKLLSDKEDRTAYFKTVIAILYNDQFYYVEGICQGKIATYESGENGFGYDSIFIPEGYNKSFAEMSLVEKNRISHRAKALLALKTFLKDESALK